MRLFYALPVPNTIRESLTDVQAELGQHCPSLRLVEPDLMHITVAFLGDADVGMAQDVGRRVAIYSTPIHLNLFGLGAFPGHHQEVGVVFAAVRGCVPLEVSLHHELGLTIRTDTKAYGLPSGHFGHITLARASSDTELSNLETQLGLKFLGSWTADCFDLLESKASPHREYRLVQRFELVS